MLLDAPIIYWYQITLRYAVLNYTRRSPKPPDILVCDRHSFLSGLESVLGRVSDVAIARTEVLKLFGVRMNRKDLVPCVPVIPADKPGPGGCHLSVRQTVCFGRQVNMDVWGAAGLKFKKPEIRDALDAPPEPCEPSVKIGFDLPAISWKFGRVAQAEH
jgi:hypothetical protein